MSKNTHWLTDPEGTRAPVEGAEACDYLIRVRGWTETVEPDRHDFVWLRNEDPALGATRMTWEAAQLDAWSGRGWTPGLPPAVAELVEPAIPEPKSSTSPKSGAAGEKKE